MAKPFVVNLADAPATRYEGAGTFAQFEDPDERFPDFGINVHMLHPGQPNAKYHSEPMQEDFLVLHGECIAIVDDEERTLRQWDFLHCPAGTEHVFIGAGDGPCWILMVGARKPGSPAHYPANEKAAKYGASSLKPTDDSREAYADWTAEPEPTKLPWPPD